MKISTKIKGLALVGCMAISMPSFAQDEIGELLVGSKDDATILTKAYLEPFFKGFGTGLNSGWYNTGTTKKLGRFEIRLGVTGAMAPSSDRSFNVNNLGLQKLELQPGQNPVAPTVVGDEIDGPTLRLKEKTDITFDLPQGLNPPKSAIPAPQAQFSIGLIKGIEVTARYVPEIEMGDEFGKIGMIGGGIKFQPLSLVSKKLNKLVPFDLAVALGYSKLTYSYDLDVQPESGSKPKSGTSAANYNDQKVEASFSGINAEAILSKKLAFFVPFVSLGYMTSTTDFGLKGNYPIVTGYDQNDGKATYETISNPININEKYINNFRASAGFGINLFLLHLYGSYNLSTYNYVNVGIGLGFGK